MVKLVVKICAFFIIFGMILGWMKSCEGDYIEKFLDDHFFSSSEKDKDDEEITCKDIENADPDQFYRYVNVKIAQLNQQYISYNSTNTSISQEISSIKNLIEQCNQSISSQTAYISKTNINQPILINWVSENKDNISQLEVAEDLQAKIEMADSKISRLETEIEDLLRAVNKNKTHFKSYIRKYNKNVIKNETVKYETIVNNFNESIVQLQQKIWALSNELKSYENDLSDLIRRSVKLCIRRLKEINEKLDKAIEQSGRPNEEDKTYYFIIDTEDELKSKGLVLSGGLFGGLKVTDSPDKEEFALLSEKDKTIMLGEEDMEFDVLSEMPADSYEYRVVNKVKVLIIKDVDRFWSRTAFLIIKKSE